MQSLAQSIVLAACVAVTLAGCSSSHAEQVTTPVKTALLGDTVSAWNTTHPANVLGGYGATMVDGSNQWDDLDSTDGIVDGWVEVLPDGMSAAEVRSRVLAEMPSDAVTVSKNVVTKSANGSCLLWQVRVPSLAAKMRELKIGDPSATFLVVLDKVGSDGWVYDSDDVTVASISVWSGDAYDLSCRGPG